MNKKEKDWKERFRDLDFLVKIKDSFGWTNEIDYEVLENFFEQEIDRVREEQNKKIEDVINEELKQGNIVILKKSKWFKKLSKLKNKSNG